MLSVYTSPQLKALRTGVMQNGEAIV